MAKLVTVVQTFFSDGKYRNNRVEIQIPDEAAEMIKKFWAEKQVHKCTEAKYLASNQSANVSLYKDETLLGGISGMYTSETEEDEIYDHHFAGDEEED